MKLTEIERRELLELMTAEISRRRLTYADLAKMTEVDASQVSRIARGKFRTFSGNVMQICIVLGLQDESRSDPRAGRKKDVEEARDDSWGKLERSLRRAWDNTPTGADRLAMVIEAVARALDR